MTGIIFDFETGDIVIKPNGTFESGTIDSQNCALISISQICRIAKPTLGEFLTSKIFNRSIQDCYKDVAAAKRAVEGDGGYDVVIEIVDVNNIQFKAKYL